MYEYDLIIVGAGLFGSTIAYKARQDGKRVLVIEKRNHVAGNIYTENFEGINVHKYGPHIFHTDNKEVWDFVNKFAQFNNFINSPIAKYRNEIYSLPFNMYTFNQMWGVTEPQQAIDIINAQRLCNTPKNLEEQAVSLVGYDVYEKLIKGYTQKQWGRPCDELPPFIIKRIPIRFEYNNNYFNDRYQGIPVEGYTKMIEKMLDGVKVILGYEKYLDNKDFWENKSDKILYTGPIDAYYNYCLGKLEYRSVEFKSIILNKKNYQGNAVVNYTDETVPWTRIIEHKFFDIERCREKEFTIITKEYPIEYKEGCEPYYPINDDKNNDIYKKYLIKSSKENKIIFGGRLGEYKYYDMDDIIENALKLYEEKIK